jgi:hypothetical protein
MTITSPSAATTSPSADRAVAGAAATASHLTYRWTDSHGQDGALDIAAEPGADRPVRAYATTPEDDARTLVAFVTRAGDPAWSTERLNSCGLDTAAARNDLIEVCRELYVSVRALD